MVEAGQPDSVSAAQIREWLQLGSEPSYRVPLLESDSSYYGRGLLSAAAIALFLRLVVVGDGRWTAAAVALLLAGLAAIWLVGADPAVATFDESGVTVRGLFLQRRTRQFAWSDLRQAEGGVLRFVQGPAVVLPATVVAERVMHLAVRLVQARQDGIDLPHGVPVPTTALSRLAADQEEAPSAALSLAPGDADDAP